VITWITQNIGTIAITLALAALVTVIVIKLAKDKRQGKCIGCDHNCKTCPHHTTPPPK